MENFIVSARKYRPATFETVVGQASITNTLKNAIKNKHLAHAYLFCGPRGVGKTTCARIFAKTINCINLSETVEACDTCESCQAFNSQRSYNIHELDAASNNSVEDIRSLIDQVRIPPQIGKHSLFIIDEVHMLSQAAFNAFLKTLEEPPAHAIFILATTEKHKILPTILSRCQIFDFNRIRIEDIQGHLANVAKKESISAESDALNIIAQKADGGMRDALSYFDQIVSYSGNQITYKDVIENLNVLDYDHYFKLTDYFLLNDIFQALLVFNSILNKGFDGHHFVTGLAKHFRDLLVCTDPQTVQLLEVGDNIREQYKAQAQRCASEFLLNALSICSKCDLEYKNSRNPRLLVELALFQLCYITKKKNELAEVDSDTENKSAFSSSVVPTVKVVENQKVATSSGEDNQEQTGQSDGSLLKKYKTSTFSIKTALTNKVSEDSVAAMVEKPLQTEVFTQDELNEKWAQFAKSKSNEVRISSNLSEHVPIIKTGASLELTLNNSLQESMFAEVKNELLVFLKTTLRNDNIVINTVIDNVRPLKTVVTVHDKYNILLEKNVALAKLKQTFGLDF
jgi:DNA polymerase III subunit gamma/tau